jgi:hypothetical protein
MRRLSIFSATSLIALVFAATAVADGPVITWNSSGTTTPRFFASCGSYNILLTFSAEGHRQSWYDANGVLVREQRHVQFTGTLYNSTDLSKQVTYDGSWERFYDASTQTWTLTGRHFRAEAPGGAVIAVDAGRELYDALTGSFLSEGEGANNYSDFVTAVCAALA